MRIRINLPNNQILYFKEQIRFLYQIIQSIRQMDKANSSNSKLSRSNRGQMHNMGRASVPSLLDNDLFQADDDKDTNYKVQTPREIQFQQQASRSLYDISEEKNHRSSLVVGRRESQIVKERNLERDLQRGIYDMDSSQGDILNVRHGQNSGAHEEELFQQYEKDVQGKEVRFNHKSQPVRGQNSSLNVSKAGKSENSVSRAPAKSEASIQSQSQIKSKSAISKGSKKQASVNRAQYDVEDVEADDEDFQQPELIESELGEEVGNQLSMRINNISHVNIVSQEQLRVNDLIVGSKVIQLQDEDDFRLLGFREFDDSNLKMCQEIKHPTAQSEIIAKYGLTLPHIGPFTMQFKCVDLILPLYGSKFGYILALVDKIATPKSDYELTQYDLSEDTKKFKKTPAPVLKQKHKESNKKLNMYKYLIPHKEQSSYGSTSIQLVQSLDLKELKNLRFFKVSPNSNYIAIILSNINKHSIEEQIEIYEIVQQEEYQDELLQEVPKNILAQNNLVFKNGIDSTQVGMIKDIVFCGDEKADYPCFAVLCDKQVAVYDFNVRVNSKQLLKNFKISDGYNNCYQSIHAVGIRYADSGIVIAPQAGARRGSGQQQSTLQQCYLACKVKGISRIDVFDIMLDSDTHGPNREREEVRSIDYEDQPGLPLVTMKVLEGKTEADGDSSPVGGVLVAVGTRNKVHQIMVYQNQGRNGTQAVQYVDAPQKMVFKGKSTDLMTFSEDALQGCIKAYTDGQFPANEIKGSKRIEALQGLYGKSNTLQLLSINADRTSVACHQIQLTAKKPAKLIDIGRIEVLMGNKVDVAWPYVGFWSSTRANDADDYQKGTNVYLQCLYNPSLIYAFSLESSVLQASQVQLMTIASRGRDDPDMLSQPSVYLLSRTSSHFIVHRICMRTKQYHVAAKYALIRVEGARAFWMRPSSDNQRLHVLHGDRLCEVELGETVTKENIKLVNTGVRQVEVGAGDDMWYMRARTTAEEAATKSSAVNRRSELSTSKPSLHEEPAAPTHFVIKRGRYAHGALTLQDMYKIACDDEHNIESIAFKPDFANPDDFMVVTVNRVQQRKTIGIRVIGKRLDQPPGVIFDKQVDYNDKYAVLSKLNGQHFGLHNCTLYFANTKVDLENLAQGLWPKGGSDRDGMTKQLVGSCQNGNKLPFVVFPKNPLNKQTLKLQIVPVIGGEAPNQEQSPSGLFRSKLSHNQHEYDLKLYFNAQKNMLVCHLFSLDILIDKTEISPPVIAQEDAQQTLQVRDVSFSNSGKLLVVMWESFSGISGSILQICSIKLDEETGFTAETMRKLDTIDSMIRALLSPRPAQPENSVLELPERLKYPFQDLLFPGQMNSMKLALQKKMAIFCDGENDIVLVMSIKTFWKQHEYAIYAVYIENLGNDVQACHLVTAKTLLEYFGIQVDGNFDEYGNSLDSEVMISNVESSLRNGFGSGSNADAIVSLQLVNLNGLTQTTILWDLENKLELGFYENQAQDLKSPRVAPTQQNQQTTAMKALSHHFGFPLPPQILNFKEQNASLPVPDSLMTSFNQIAKYRATLAALHMGSDQNIVHIDQAIDNVFVFQAQWMKERVIDAQFQADCRRIGAFSDSVYRTGSMVLREFSQSFMVTNQQFEEKFGVRLLKADALTAGTRLSIYGIRLDWMDDNPSKGQQLLQTLAESASSLETDSLYNSITMRAVVPHIYSKQMAVFSWLVYPIYCIHVILIGYAVYYTELELQGQGQDDGSKDQQEVYSTKRSDFIVSSFVFAVLSLVVFAAQFLSSRFRFKCGKLQMVSLQGIIESGIFILNLQMLIVVVALSTDYSSTGSSTGPSPAELTHVRYFGFRAVEQSMVVFLLVKGLLILPHRFGRMLRGLLSEIVSVLVPLLALSIGLMNGIYQLSLSIPNNTAYGFPKQNHSFKGAAQVLIGQVSRVGELMGTLVDDLNAKEEEWPARNIHTLVLLIMLILLSILLIFYAVAWLLGILIRHLSTCQADDAEPPIHEQLLFIADNHWWLDSSKYQCCRKKKKSVRYLIAAERY